MDDLVRGSHGVAAPGVGPAWRRSRFAAPYLRNALWDAGYAVDTLETATDWTTLPALATALGADASDTAWRPPASGSTPSATCRIPTPTGSSLYTTYVFRLAADPDETLERWRTLKSAASEVDRPPRRAPSATSTASGSDHAPYLAAEKGPLGMRAIEALVRDFDPDGVMHRGVLLEDAAASERRPSSSSRSTSGRRASGRSSSTPRARSSPSARIPIEPYVSPQPGWAEQDPELYWRTLGEACRRVLADPAVRPRARSPGWHSPPSAARSW